jgi:pimeloyl-ACP methyl ester carboxylesterase
MELGVEGRRVAAATGGRPFDGARPAIVFLHGAGMDHTAWQLPARWFAWHGWSVLAPDLPGHGASEGPPLAAIAALAQWTAALLDAAGLARAALVGHSMGAAVALETAAALGERIERVALLGSALSIPVNVQLLEAARTSPARAYQMIAAWGHASRAKLGPNPVPGLWMVGGTLALLARNRSGVLHADLAACSAWRGGAAAAARVAGPVLVLSGASDVMTPSARGGELAGALAQGRTVTLSDCGHMMLAEAPDRVLDCLIDFFKSPSAACEEPATR